MGPSPNVSVSFHAACCRTLSVRAGRSLAPISAVTASIRPVGTTPFRTELDRPRTGTNPIPCRISGLCGTSAAEGLSLNIGDHLTKVSESSALRGRSDSLSHEIPVTLRKLDQLLKQLALFWRRYNQLRPSSSHIVGACPIWTGRACRGDQSWRLVTALKFVRRPAHRVCTDGKPRLERWPGALQSIRWASESKAPRLPQAQIVPILNLSVSVAVRQARTYPKCSAKARNPAFKSLALVDKSLSSMKRSFTATRFTDRFARRPAFCSASKARL